MMTAFDAGTPGSVVLDGPFELSAETYPAARLRLAMEIHRRLYHDSGVEVVLGDPGDELERTYTLRTPYCLHADAAIAELTWRIDQRRLAHPNGREFEGWADFRERAFIALEVDSWYTRRHLGCFHRRGKAKYDLAFAVMTELVSSGDTAHMTRAWTFSPVRADDRAFAELIATMGGPILADQPSRYLAISCCGEALAALRSDGWAATTSGSLALDELWKRGAGIDRLADAVRGLAAHGCGRGPAAGGTRGDGGHGH